MRIAEGKVGNFDSIMNALEVRIDEVEDKAI
jgi:hypothetical protein